MAFARGIEANPVTVGEKTVGGERDHISTQFSGFDILPTFCGGIKLQA